MKIKEKNNFYGLKGKHIYILAQKKRILAQKKKINLLREADPCLIRTLILLLYLQILIFLFYLL